MNESEYFVVNESEYFVVDESCSPEQYLIFESNVQILFCLLYFFIGVFGITANAAMIVFTLR